LDYTIHLLELRSVDFTAAAEDNFFLRAGDATDCTKGTRYLRAVLLASFQTDKLQLRRAEWRALRDRKSGSLALIVGLS
jgi:hypothetical protein